MRESHVSMLQRPSSSPADRKSRKSHEFPRRDKTILVQLGDDDFFFPRLPREREFPSCDRRIAIYSNKRTADLSCERDGQ